MNCQIGEEEEKKEATGGGDGNESKSGRFHGTEDDTSDDDDDETEELQSLPSDIAGRVGDTFESEEALEEALVNAGVGDLPVVLVNGKPRLVIPSDQHNAFTGNYCRNFERWAQSKWGCCSATHKVHLQNGRSRDPDLSYWGYPRCCRDKEGDLEPIDVGKGPVPDVIIQFSWKNTALYEESAIDAMMNRALTKHHGEPSNLPRVGYLIKVRFSRKRKLQNGEKTQDVEGLDIYRLTQGTTMGDALDPNISNATHYRYNPSGPEYYITITPDDLGITGFWAFWCGGYKIKASVLFQKLREMQDERQMDGLAM